VRGVALPGPEALGAALAARPGAPVVEALVEVARPARVLALGGGSARRLAAMAARGWPWIETLVGVDPSAESVAAADARLADVAGPRPAVALHHATFRRGSEAVPHFTRRPGLVRALCEDGFDLVVLEVAPPERAFYLDLAQAVALARPGGVLVCEGAAELPGGREAVERVVREGGAVAVWSRPADGRPATALVRPRTPRHTHEDTAALRSVVAEDPEAAAALAGRDHVRICGALRHWLARRLAWSTQDLLLPLAALPPPLAAVDVVEQCALGEGGVWGFGAAVTLAMVYRAFGYPATVYQHGVAGVWWHMLTLVQVPDGRILLEDALFDGQVRLDGRPATLTQVLAAIPEGGGGRLSLPSELDERRHLYSRASLAAAEADGWLTAAERARLETAMRGAERVLGEPRAGLVQAASCSLERFTALPVHARILERIAAGTGVASPLWFLAVPFGRIPLTGRAGFDGKLARLLDPLRRDRAAPRAAREARA
jgi:SAM-dependent methyltransferase